jgi:hypothetical protein
MLIADNVNCIGDKILVKIHVLSLALPSLYRYTFNEEGKALQWQKNLKKTRR